MRVKAVSGARRSARVVEVAEGLLGDVDTI